MILAFWYNIGTKTLTYVSFHNLNFNLSQLIPNLIFVYVPT